MISNLAMKTLSSCQCLDVLFLCLRCGFLMNPFYTIMLKFDQHQLAQCYKIGSKNLNPHLTLTFCQYLSTTCPMPVSSIMVLCNYHHSYSISHWGFFYTFHKTTFLLHSAACNPILHYAKTHPPHSFTMLM